MFFSIIKATMQLLERFVENEKQRKMIVNGIFYANASDDI